MRRRLPSAAFLLLLLPMYAAAQSVSGTILGTVTDSSGSVVPNAKVTIVNEGTALTRTVQSDANGEYTVPSLPTGRYRVISEMTGFKTTTLSNIELGVDQRVRIKNTKVGRYNTELRIEAFNVLNHPQFAQPNSTLGNAAVGTISAMLSSPSCSLCGTTERQVQIGVKVRF